MSIPMTETRQAEATGAGSRRRALAGGQAPRSGVRRQVPVRRAHHRSLLPAELRLAAGEAGERLVLSDRRGGGESGLSRLQALPARQARRARSANGGGQAGVRADRAAEEAPKLADLAASVGLSPYHFHRVFKSDHRRDPEGLCGRDAGAPRRRQAAHGGDGHRSDLRRGLQLFEPLLREHGGAARHDAGRGPARRGRGGHSLRGRRGLARRGAGRRDEQGRVRDPARRRPACARARLAGPLPARGASGRRCRIRAHGRRSRRPGRGAGSAPGSAARHPRHRVPAAGVGGAAAPYLPARRRPTRRSPGRSASRKRCARSPRPAAPIRLRSRFPAIAWCGRTATSPAIAGASSASAS